MKYKNLEELSFDEAVYIGEFRNHKREGYGEMTWRSGKDIYKGYWSKD